MPTQADYDALCELHIQDFQVWKAAMRDLGKRLDAMNRECERLRLENDRLQVERDRLTRRTAS